jgi:DNA (cytosine-5)-methyltransferase 1
MSKLKVVELFAGVGGFRIGLEKTNKYEVVWSNQWEPGKSKQHASDIYTYRFGTHNHSNEDIETVETKHIPNHDVLVGGFPCQDYSVASLLKNSKGLLGKKGVLWWSIYRILDEKKKKPSFLILENVDRLLGSPVNQKGRDFAMMLSSLNNLGYAVEWRVINAGDYGMPQRRRRVFIIGYYKNSKLYKDMKDSNVSSWIHKEGLFAKQFKVQQPESLFLTEDMELDSDLKKVSEKFNLENQNKIFKNAGVMIDGKVTTTQIAPVFKGKQIRLKDVLQKVKVSEEFYISDEDLVRWKIEKGAKSKIRTKDGFTYEWKEGAISFPDNLDKPSRTIITSEGGKSPARIKHVVETKYGKRRLTPIELERLNMFPDDHTLLDGVSNNLRAFLMGNALVIGIVTKIGREIANRIK